MSDSSNEILIMDDEPHVLDWLIEFLEKKGYKITIAVNVDEAIKELDRSNFRVAIFDLNVPASDEILTKIRGKSSVHEKYRGLYAAEYARTRGLRGRQVIVYSVHDSDEVQGKCDKVGIQYLIKARPREFKNELIEVLNFDPTEK